MSLSAQIMEHIKDAMRAKDTVALEALRSIKSELLLAQTASGSKEEITEDEEIKLLQRLVKTRKESAKIYTEQNRPDLAEPELAQVAVIEKFLPAQLSEAEVETVVAKIIAETGASGIASMGKVMGLATAQLGGTAEGKTISAIVKKLLV
ncbi:GatB/YqeY domain-containing protein [Flavobacterium sp.]|uniref:GatB/YqeY domain-containing protein n=1 Tax=Flavobacterium sp. TaxID=239 RepID=UPI00263A35C6|nr:GatB/YqeY domain-containing protein [Flavobacterium sp.]